MKQLMIAGAFAMLYASPAAFAAPGLTPHECASYPFVRTGHVTPRQLKRELAELESVGYRLGDDNDADYPNQIEAAEARLHAEYRQDCKRGPSGADAMRSGSERS